MEKKIKQIIVYGGTGYFGRKVVEALVRKGQSVKVVSRNPENARRILGDDVEIYGGVEAGILLNSTSKQVYQRTKEILQSGIMEGGRFVLRDANNLPPPVNRSLSRPGDPGPSRL